MKITETRYEHIELDKQKKPIISGSTMKVVELVLNKKAYGWSAEELHLQHPHLSLGQIHSALAYYWDHQVQLDEDIENRLTRINELEMSLGTSPLKARLVAKGLI